MVLQRLHTEELMKKTTDKSDCCMLSVVEWGHSLEVCEEDPDLKMKIIRITLVSLNAK